MKNITLRFTFILMMVSKNKLFNLITFLFLPSQNEALKASLKDFSNKNLVCLGYTLIWVKLGIQMIFEKI
jgi:hypothetical protein